MNYPHKLREGALLVLCLVITTLTYAPGLSGPLLLDDEFTIRPLLESGRWPTDWTAQMWSTTGPLGRPISMLSFFLSAAMSGSQLTEWKEFNLGLHLILGGLLWWFVRLLCSAVYPPPPRWVPAAVCIAWLIHPLQLSTVFYTVQRMTQLSAIFVVIGLCCYLSARVGSAPLLRRRLLFWSAFLVWTPLAALSKENGLLLPAFIALLESVVLVRQPCGDLARDVRVAITACVALPAVGSVAYLAWNFQSQLVEPHLNRGLGLGAHLLTQARVLVMYLAQIVLPRDQWLGFIHDDIVPSDGFLSPPTTLVAILFLIALIVFAWKVRAVAPLVSFGAGAFFVGHTIESTIFPLELMFEHRNYLPSFGILLAIISAVGSVRRPLHMLAVGGAVVSLLFLALNTSSLARIWGNEAQLFTMIYRAHPHSERVVSLLVDQLVAKGRYDDALRLLATVGSAGARLHAAALHCARGQVMSSEILAPTVFSATTHLSTYEFDGLMTLARLDFEQACQLPAETMEKLLQDASTSRIAFARQRQRLLIWLARYRWNANDAVGAFATLEAGYRALPRDPLPLLMAAEWALARKDPQAAEEYLARAGTVSGTAREHAAMVAALEEEIARAVRGRDGSFPEKTLLGPTYRKLQN